MNLTVIDHPLARQSRAISTSQLTHYPWVLPDPQTPLYGYWTDMMTAGGEAPPHVTIECGSVLTIRELLLETDMLTLLSPDQSRVEIEAGLLVPRDPPSPVTRMIGITTRQDWRPTQPQQRMIETLHLIGKKIS